MTSLSYHELTRWRVECAERFGEVLDFPMSGPFQSCLKYCKKGKVLDVGAGVEKSAKKWLNLDGDRYFSLDSDPAGQFDYHDFDDIPGDARFSLVIMNQFLEHLTIDDAHAMLRRAFACLESGGALVASVPNAHHPVRYHADVTHVTNWPYNDLYGLFRHVGFEVVQLARSNKRRWPGNWLKRWIVRTVCEEIRVDWCDTLIIEAKRP
jgi:predicted SAM-dependent methyltransferase